MTYADRLKHLERHGTMPPANSPKNRAQSRNRLDAAIQRCGPACVYCGTARDLTVDHYIPRARGGRSDSDNLVPACGTCNGAKGDQLPLNYIQARLAEAARLAPLPASAGYPGV